MILLNLVGGVVAAAMLIAPVLYGACQTPYFERGEDFASAVAIALAGMVLGGVVDLLVGWIPAVGPFASALAWAYVVKHAAGGDWPGSLLVGFVAWALSVGFYAGLALL